MISLKKIIFKNFISETGRQGITAIEHLLLVPLFLSFWEIDTYAEWIIISVIPTYLLLGNLGITSYGANLICIAYNQNKRNEVNFIFKNVFFFTCILILFFLIVFLFFDYLFNFRHILKISSLSQTGFSSVIILLVLKLLFSTLTSFLLMLLRAIHKNHILNLFIILFSLTEFLLIIAILLNRGGILDVALIGTLNYFVAFVFTYLFIKKRFRWFNTKKIKISFLYLKKILYPSASFMIPNLSRSFIIQGTIIFIATTLNNNLLIFYNSMRIVLNGMKQLINTYSISFCPEIMIFFAKKKIKKIAEMYKSLLKYNTIISITVVFILIFFIKEPFLYWTKGVIKWEFNFFIIFLAASCLEWLNLPTINLPYAINKHVGLNKIHFFSFVIYWILLLSLFETLDIYAVPNALIFSMLYFLIHNFIYTKNLFNKPLVLKKVL